MLYKEVFYSTAVTNLAVEILTSYDAGDICEVKNAIINLQLAVVNHKIACYKYDYDSRGYTHIMVMSKRVTFNRQQHHIIVIV